MTTIWLRHGETALNASRVIQPADTPLSERGRAQAAAAARRLAALGPVAVVSSDLPRARETAEAVAAAVGLTVLTEPLLRERNFGTLRGRSHDSLGFDALRMIEAPPEGESMAEFLARAARAWTHVQALRATLNGPLVVVSHGLLIHAALHHHAHWDGEPTLPSPLGNTSVSIVAAELPARVLLAGCTAHLDDDAPLASGAV
jgi:broad specificity phosphatase PhoE